MSKRKGIVIGIITAAAVTAGAVGVFAAGAGIAKTNSIGEKSAIKFAFTDAGIEEKDVLYEKTGFEYERGKYVYDIEFRTLDAEYDYDVDSYTGEIISKSIEPWEAEDGAETAAPVSSQPYDDKNDFDAEEADDENDDD